MKIAKKGLSTRETVVCTEALIRGKAADEAVANYREKRGNWFVETRAFVCNDSSFPRDGRFQWVYRRKVRSKIRYVAGKADNTWMKERDKEYLEKLYDENFETFGELMLTLKESEHLWHKELYAKNQNRYKRKLREIQLAKERDRRNKEAREQLAKEREEKESEKREQLAKEREEKEGEKEEVLPISSVDQSDTNAIIGLMAACSAGLVVIPIFLTGSSIGAKIIKGGAAAAGMSGLSFVLANLDNPDVEWGDFACEIGKGAVVGAATGGVAMLATRAKLSPFWVSILSGITATTVRTGLDKGISVSGKDMMSAALKGAAVGSASNYVATIVGKWLTEKSLEVVTRYPLGTQLSRNLVCGTGIIAGGAAGAISGAAVAGSVEGLGQYFTRDYDSSRLRLSVIDGAFVGGLLGLETGRALGIKAAETIRGARGADLSAAARLSGLTSGGVMFAKKGLSTPSVPLDSCAASSTTADSEEMKPPVSVEMDSLSVDGTSVYKDKFGCNAVERAKRIKAQFEKFRHENNEHFHDETYAEFLLDVEKRLIHSLSHTEQLRYFVDEGGKDVFVIEHATPEAQVGTVIGHMRGLDGKAVMLPWQEGRECYGGMFRVAPGARFFVRRRGDDGAEIMHEPGTLIEQATPCNRGPLYLREGGAYELEGSLGTLIDDFNTLMFVAAANGAQRCSMDKKSFARRAVESAMRATLTNMDVSELDKAKELFQKALADPGVERVVVPSGCEGHSITVSFLKTGAGKVSPIIDNYGFGVFDEEARNYRHPIKTITVDAGEMLSGVAPCCLREFDLSGSADRHALLSYFEQAFLCFKEQDADVKRVYGAGCDATMQATLAPDTLPLQKVGNCGYYGSIAALMRGLSPKQLEHFKQNSIELMTEILASTQKEKKAARSKAPASQVERGVNPVPEPPRPGPPRPEPPRPRRSCGSS